MLTVRIKIRFKDRIRVRIGHPGTEKSTPRSQRKKPKREKRTHRPDMRQSFRARSGTSMSTPPPWTIHLLVIHASMSRVWSANPLWSLQALESVKEAKVRASTARPVTSHTRTMFNTSST